MPQRRYFDAIPSRRVTRRHYAEQLDWWAASGWLLEVEDAADGRLMLHTAKRKTTGGFSAWGATATPEETATPDLTRRFLAASLYLHLHPIKAQRAHALTGQVCTEAELAAFIRQQRRKASVRRLSVE